MLHRGLVPVLGDELAEKQKVRAVGDAVELVAESGDAASLHALVLEFDKQ